jgi:hypothetical protein
LLGEARLLLKMDNKKLFYDSLASTGDGSKRRGIELDIY